MAWHSVVPLSVFNCAIEQNWPLLIHYECEQWMKIMQRNRTIQFKIFWNVIEDKMAFSTKKIYGPFNSFICDGFVQMLLLNKEKLL